MSLIYNQHNLLTPIKSNPGTFITVLSGWSVFLSPMTGIVISDYFLVRHGEYHLGDMYMGNSRSAYWYTSGFNWRCFTAWALGMAPLLRKSDYSQHHKPNSLSRPSPSKPCQRSFRETTLTFCARISAGFARAVQGVSSGSGWDHLYQMSYLYGFFASMTMHWLFHALFPTEKQRGSSPFVLEEHAEMLYAGESDSVTRAGLTDEERVVAMPKF